MLRTVLGRGPTLAVPVLGAGLLGGVVGAVYVSLLHLVQRGLWPTHWDALPHLGILVAAGAGIALLTRALGQTGDVELLVDNIHVAGGVEDLRNLRSLVPVSLLGIGAGGGLGPEAPLVQTTGALGSWMGRRRDLGPIDRRTLTITGMAAGFTVLFGAPLGSAVFALEILHRRGLEYYEALIPAVVGSLCGYGVYLALTGVGLDPVWDFPAGGALRSVDLLWAAGCGVVGAVVAVAFTYLCTGLRRLVGLLPWGVRPAVGGAAIGVVALFSSYGPTFGEAQLQQLLDRRATLTIGLLLGAFVAKLLCTSLTVASGWRGGFIIPLFFMGFCLGQAAHLWLPGTNAWVLSTSLMVAANVGVTKTPIGSTLVVTEMTGFALLPTSVLAAVVSLGLTSGVGLIATQRERQDPLPDGGAS